jgi:hypothetical protein
MKKLDKKSIDLLLEIIPNHPGLRISQFSDGGDSFSNALSELSLLREYEFQLNVVDNEEFYEKAQQLYSKEKLSSVKRIKWDQRRYASPAKQYDFLFITADIPKNHRKLFAKTIHSHIKSSGHLVLFLEKDNYQNIDEWYSFLEEYLFVAINTIDLFDNYEILIAKKMHGWGGK